MACQVNGSKDKENILESFLVASFLAFSAGSTPVLTKNV